MASRLLERAWLPLGMPMVVVALSVYAGRLVASGSLRTISLALIAVLAAHAIRLTPRVALACTLSVVPLPLFMQGLGVSLTVAIVGGVWLAAIAQPPSCRAGSGGRTILLSVAAVGVMGAVAVVRGAPDRLGSDLSAFGRLSVGLALFLACVYLLRTDADLRLAFSAIGISGGIVLAVTLVQLLAPSLPIPGLIGGVGTIQRDVYGVSENLRVGGPLDDYELLGEFFALTALICLALGLTTAGRSRALWLALAPLLVLGLATTSTRSGLFLVVVGAGALFLPFRRRIRLRVLVGGVALLAVVAPTVLTLFQQRFSTAFIIERIQSLDSTSGFVDALGRADVWRYFLNQRPTGLSLIFGQGPGFDLDRYGLYPHSLPLALAFSAGLLFAGAFYVLLGAIGWQAFTRWRVERMDLGLLASVLVLVFAVNELKIEFIRVFNYEWFVWGLLGVCAATARARVAR